MKSVSYGNRQKLGHICQLFDLNADPLLWRATTQNLGAKQKQVLDALRFFPDATNAEIAAHLAWPINRVTPRMGELRIMGLVFESCRRRCKITGGMAWAHRAKYPVLPPAFPKAKEVESNKQTLF